MSELNEYEYEGNGEKNVTNVLVNGADLHKTPSNVEVETEIIRNTERALDGTMCIDVVAKKLGLKISWALLADDDYKQLKKQFPFNGTIEINAENTQLFSRKDYAVNDDNSNEKFTCYVEAINAVPVFLSDGLYWQNVTISVAEV